MRCLLWLALALLPSLAAAVEIGDVVVVVAEGQTTLYAEITADSDVVVRVPWGRLMTVVDVQDDWCRVDWKSHSGWLEPGSYMVEDEAMEHFTAAIEVNPSAAD
jgi:SH3-like domain-containing protein